MKYSRFFSLMILGACLFASCESKETVGEKQLAIKADYTTILEAETTSAELSVITNIKDGLVVEVTDQTMGEWLTASYKNGRILLTAEPEQTFYGKIATVTITDGFNSSSVKVLRKGLDSSEETDYNIPPRYTMPWNDSWTVDGFVYKDKGNFFKYDGYMWGDNGLPKNPENGNIWYTIGSADRITLGLKLEQPLLDYFKGKKIIGLELKNSSFMTKNSLEFAIVRVEPEANAILVPEWQREGLLSQTEILWRSGNVRDANNEWQSVAINPGIDIPESGDIMCVVYLDGDGSVYHHTPDAADPYERWDSMLIYNNQHISKFAPCYLSLTGNDGKNMFLFKGGIYPFNIYFSL